MSRPYKGLSEYMDDVTIRQLRAKYRLSQNDLAHTLGVSAATIRTWEKEGAFIPLLAQYAINYLRQELAIAEEDKANGSTEKTRPPQNSKP